MKTFSEFLNCISEDADAATIARMSDEQFQELLKRTSAAKRNQLLAQRQSAPASSRVTSSATPNLQAQPRRVAPTIPTNRVLPAAAANTTRPSLLNRAKGLAAGTGRVGAAIALDTAAEIGIDQIRDKQTRERVRGAKELAVGAMTPLYSAASIPSGGAVTRDDLEIKDPFGYGGKLTKDFSRGSGKDSETYADWLKSDFKGGMLPTWLGGAKAGPKYNDPRTNVRYTSKDGQTVRVGAAKQGGEILPVEWGSVAGEKRVGTPQDVAAVQARQRAGQQGAYGSRQGVAVVGTGGRTTVNRKDNTITSGGRTAQLPSTKILAGGRVGDLAYKDGKPVYLARADMAQRGNQGLFARLSRATGIGGQREKDAAALKREREQALQNTLRYRQQIGAGGGSISAK